MENVIEENSVQEAKTEKKKKKVKKSPTITVKANKKGKHKMWFMDVMRIFMIPFFWLVKPFRYYGAKVKDGACLYVCNHYTLVDSFYTACTTWEGVHFIAKKENFETPFLRTILRLVKGIRANRDGNDVRTVLDAIKCLKNGEKVAISPEGTRNKTDAEMLPFHHGASAIAIRTKTPIVPVMLYKKPRYFKMTHVLVGEAFELSEYYGKKLTEADIIDADNKIREVMLNLRKEHTAYLESKKRKKA